MHGRFLHLSASMVFSRLALKINEKVQGSYSDAIGYIRTKISFPVAQFHTLYKGCRSVCRQNPEELSFSALIEKVKLSWFIWTSLQLWYFICFLNSRCRSICNTITYFINRTCTCWCFRYFLFFVWGRNWHCNEALQRSGACFSDCPYLIRGSLMFSPWTLTSVRTVR